MFQDEDEDEDTAMLPTLRGGSASFSQPRCYSFMLPPSESPGVDLMCDCILPHFRPHISQQGRSEAVDEATSFRPWYV